MSAPPRFVTSDEFVRRVGDGSLVVLDVRELDEVAAWPMPGALTIPLGQLSVSLGAIPRDGDVVVVCAKGARALEGARILAAAGIASVVLDGGMAAWASTYDEAVGEFAGASVVQVRRRGKGCLSYVVGAGTRALVIDPSTAIERYARIAGERGWRIDHVVDTHLHADHLSGARALAASSQATLWLSASDPFHFDFEPLVDGATLELGGEVALTVRGVAVPGHTPGSTMLALADEAIFTGDTLFVESVGRPDLADQAERYARHLHHSLRTHVVPRGDETTVLPAHYGASVAVERDRLVAARLGDLRRTLAALAFDEADFVAWALAHVTDRPANYRRIVAVNAGDEVAGEESVTLEIGPNRCAIV